MVLAANRSRYGARGSARWGAVTRPGRASSAGPAAPRATAATPGPATRRRSPAARFALHCGDERLADLVLPHLRVETDDLVQDRREAGGLATRVEHARHARLSGNVVASDPVHHAVAVSFEQRHERLHAGERPPLLVGCQERDEPTVVERVAPVAQFFGGARQRLHEAARIGVDRRQRRVDQREVVRLHPRHRRELRPVRALVNRDPQPEVARPERESLLQREDVAAHVVDGVGRTFLLVEDEQVVLAEHALREVPEQHTGLGTGDPTPDRRHRAPRHPFADTGGQRFEQAAHRSHVGRHPAGAVDDLRARRTRYAKPGVVCHELLGNGRDRGEVGPQGLGKVRGRQGISPRNAAGHALGEPPVEGIEGRRRGVGASLRLERHDCFCPRHFGLSTRT